MRKLALLSTLLGLLALVFIPTVLKNHGIYLFTYWLIYVIAAMGSPNQKLKPALSMMERV